MTRTRQTRHGKLVGAKPLIIVAVIAALVVAAVLTSARWKPWLQQFTAYVANEAGAAGEEHDHDHGHGEAADSVSLSDSAWKNIGLVTARVSPTDFVKTVPVPAMVVERPGRTRILVAAPMTAVVTRVYALDRQAVRPGQPLFDLRLTHEDVVSAQSEFLKQLQAADVINRELQRLQGIGESVIPGKRIIEQEYKRDEAMSALAALRQSLKMHGMSEEQLVTIEQTRELLREVTVVAPPYAEQDQHTDVEHQYHVQEIGVDRGQSVEAGTLLGILADHCLLYVEGQAFEDDASHLLDAAARGTPIEVAPVARPAGDNEALQLEIQSVADQVDPRSRALTFNLLLPNEPAPDTEGAAFVAWKFRPGQRMEARIPTTDVMKNRIVLPVNAVVIEGPNAWVFEQNGDHFDRIDVHVEYRDRDVVVLENDGRLAGSVLAMNGAWEMHLELKNQAGGAIDPHAGHQH